MDVIHTGDALVGEPLDCEPSTAVEWSIRLILILGFAAALALEAYLIWEAFRIL